jgi:putative Mg2+ transporter-C (MgtC) family protein
VRFTVSDGDAILRIALAGALGLLVGLERLVRGNPAGPRTFALLAMGAAAFSVVAAGYRNDARVVAGIVTGVGFIGAGMIWHDSARGVVGFATAAASWATVAVGVLAGLDRALVALALAGMCLLVLELQYAPFIDWFWRHRRIGPHEQEPRDDEGMRSARQVVDEPSPPTTRPTTDRPSSPE